jgi:hypothetical protein
MRLAVLTPWVIVALATGPAPAGPLFAPGPPVNVGVGSGAVLLADLNADGHVDMLTRHLTNRTITLSFGGRQEGFGRPMVRPLAYEPGDMKLGDLNADGVLDLAVTPGRQDVVHVLLGDGRGDFEPAPGSPFTVTDAIDELNKRTLHLIDLNEDAHLDIVTANGRRRNTLGALLGNGRGGFTRGPAVTLESGRDRYWYAFGDLDGDRHLDVVTASSGLDAAGAAGRLLVQSGDGRGGFTAMSPSPIPIAAGPGPVSLSDVNRDGRLDVAVAHNNGEVSILINSGRGQFAQAPGSPVKLGSRPYALVVQDVNRDHRPDLLAATVDSITVWLGTASGYTPAPGSPFRAGPGAYNFTLGDVNKDGTLDLAASSFEGESVTLLLGRTDGVP